LLGERTYLGGNEPSSNLAASLRCELEGRCEDVIASWSKPLDRGKRTIHHYVFDAVSAENQATVKNWLVRLGFTDVSDVKDRGYFLSVYMRSPGGALIELAYSTPQGFLIDEAEDELGTHMCIPPHWEHRRAEIAQLEPIETVETIVG
jgi:glyoxalase family protein